MSQRRGRLRKRAMTFVWLVALSIGVASCGPGSPAATPMPTNTNLPPSAIAEPTQTLLPLTATVVTVEPATAAPSTVTPLPLLSPEATGTQEAVPSATTIAETTTPLPTLNVGDLQWKQVGLAGTAIIDLAFAGEGANLLVAAGPNGVWHTTYDYTKWAKYSVDFSSKGPISEVAIGSSDVIYVTNHTGCASGAPITRYRTANGGKTWQAISGEVLRVAASNAVIGYAATCGSIEKTTDAGSTWSTLKGSMVVNFDIQAIAASPDGETVYASYASEGGHGRIMMSTNGGVTWKEITPKNAPNNEFHATANLFFVPGSEGRPQDGGLYMANDQGLWFLPLESSDWKLIIEKTSADTQPGRVYYVTALYIDTNYSEEYNKPGPVIYTARVAQGAESAEGLGVFRSTDGGATWQSVGKNLTKSPVNSLVLAPQDQGTSANKMDTLVAATGDGVWALPMPPSR